MKGYLRLALVPLIRGDRKGPRASMGSPYRDTDKRGNLDPNWDNNHGGCGFLYETTWQAIQACHPGTFVTNAYMTTDPGISVMFLIDNLLVAGKMFSQAADNSNGDGDNTTATFTPDLLSLLSNPITG